MTQNWALRAKSEEHQSTMNDVLQRCLSRPAKMLILEPILLCMCTYISVTFGKSIMPDSMDNKPLTT